MKYNHHTLMALLLGSGLTLLATSASAAVLGSKHDLSAGSDPTSFTSAAADSDQTCVFCHTPHGAAAAANQIVPLWNRTTSAATYTLYADTGAGTLTGKTADDGAATGGIGGVSLACLSCHDGTVAIASVLNKPGSGTAADTAWAAGTWSAGGAVTGGVGAFLTGPALLDSNMSNDHPVAIQYAGGGYTITGAGPYTLNGTPATVNDTFFTGLALSGNQAWVDVDTSGTKTTGDLPLFTNTLPASTTKEPFVECASCHDPHNGTANGMFLRAAAANSAICTACHIK